MPKRKNKAIAPVDHIASHIYMVRGHKVMIDSDLAELYGVTTGNLNLAVRRNPIRFPVDFAFQLSSAEFETLLLQNARANTRGGRRTPPYAFTEQGVAMLSSVLRSDRAAEMNVAIMRAFVKLRELLSSNRELARKLEDLERKVGNHDAAIADIIAAIRQLMSPVASKKRPIGYIHPDDRE